MGLWMAADCLLTSLNVGALIGLTNDRDFRKRNELLTRLRPAPVRGTLAMRRWNPALRPTEIRTRYVCLWKQVEITKQFLRLSNFHLSSTSSSELTISPGVSSIAGGCFNDTSSSVPTVYPTAATLCSMVAAWLPEGNGVLAHDWFCTLSSGEQCYGAMATVRSFLHV